MQLRKLPVRLLISFLSILTCVPLISQSVDTRIRQGQEALAKQDLDQAKQHFKAAHSGIRTTAQRIQYYHLGEGIAEADRDTPQQRAYLDSLLLLMRANEYAGDRLEVYRKYAFSYVFFDGKAYLSWQDSIIQLARQIGDTATWVTSLLEKSGMYQQTGQLNNVMALSREVLAIPGASAKDRARAWLNLGMNSPQEKADSARIFFHHALDILNIVQDSFLFSTYYQTYGNFLRRSGELTHATEAQLQSIQYTPDGFGSDLKKIVTLNSIARIFQQLGDIEKEKEYMLMAVEMADKGKLKYRNSILAGEYGQLLYRLGEPEEGEQELRKAIATFESDKKAIKIVEYKAILGRLLVQNHQLDAASLLEKELVPQLLDFPTGEKAYHDALLFRASLVLEQGKNKLALSYLDQPELNWNASQKRDYYALSIRALENLGQHDAALNRMRLDNQLRDSLDNTQQEMVVYDIESRYRQVEKEKEIADLRMTNEVQSLRLGQKNQLNGILLTGLLLFSLLGAVIWQLYQKARRRKEVAEAALADRELLMREIHHRVKNNLQVISSLLNLQSKYVTDETALEAIKAGRSRVRSMALIHQDLYQEGNLMSIAARPYLERLIDELNTNYRMADQKVSIQLDIQELRLDIDTMIPVGLIINELMSNALKYAFVSGQEGFIQVSLKEKDQQLILELSDNGRGIDPEKTGKENPSFGYKLIHAFTGKLDGKITVSNDSGTRVRFEFSSYEKVD